ncbi:hypothetical protein BDF22DRAFT_695335 [Syncephalis plumigaleata]|nr:hypothetical protein BDF22DRAFT_695335 [Syncephalis plumigaleata]
MDDEWKETATRWLGIPLHPLGEISFFDFILGKPEHDLSKEEVQARMTGLHRQLLFYTALSLMFGHNLCTIIGIAFKQPRNVTVWCCIFTSFLGTSLFLVALLSGLLTTMNCRQLIWCGMLLLGVSTIANSFLLLYKAYLALLRRYWVAGVGALMLCLQAGFMLCGMATVPITVKEYDGCVAHYTQLLSYTWLGTIMPTNVFFSAIFCYVAYTQYRIYGSDAWKRLADDGIQTMCMVILCNIVCGLFIIFRVLGDFSEIFFMIDWLLTTSILVNHCSNIFKVAASIAKSNSATNKCANTGVDITETVTTLHGYIPNTTTYTVLS